MEFLRPARKFAVLAFILVMSNWAFADDVTCPQYKPERHTAPAEMYSIETERVSDETTWFQILIDSTHADKPLKSLYLFRGTDEEMLFAASLSLDDFGVDEKRVTFVATTPADDSRLFLVATYADKGDYCPDTDTQMLEIPL